MALIGEGAVQGRAASPKCTCRSPPRSIRPRPGCVGADVIEGLVDLVVEGSQAERSDVRCRANNLPATDLASAWAKTSPLDPRQDVPSRRGRGAEPDFEVLHKKIGLANCVFRRSRKHVRQ